MVRSAIPRWKVFICWYPVFKSHMKTILWTSLAPNKCVLDWIQLRSFKNFSCVKTLSKCIESLTVLIQPLCFSTVCWFPITAVDRCQTWISGHGHLDRKGENVGHYSLFSNQNLWKSSPMETWARASSRPACGSESPLSATSALALGDHPSVSGAWLPPTLMPSADVLRGDGEPRQSRERCY